MHRQREPEDRTLARLTPGLQPTAVQVRVLGRDRQPQPGSSRGASTGLVGAPEPVEDHRRLSRSQAYPMVAHAEGDRPAVTAHPYDDVSPLAVLDGVRDQVPYDPLDPSWI